nr:hypothetical protein [uncultured Undibacterium sp.]
MKQRPILFSAPMVRALLDGSKTQTRRLVKGMALDWLENDKFKPEFVAHPENHMCKYGDVGDQLWVRETHLIVCKMDDNGMFITDGHGEYIYETWYRADGIEYQYFDGESDFPAESIPWKPSIHMPRAASRITLEITNIRVEHLQDISSSDAASEGIVWNPGDPWTCDSSKGLTDAYRALYAELWESINGAESWDANPWVWVIEFKRVEQ